MNPSLQFWAEPLGLFAFLERQRMLREWHKDLVRREMVALGLLKPMNIRAGC